MYRGTSTLGGKVFIFLEGRKNLQNLHLTFVYRTYVSTEKSKMEIFQNFVAFSEYMSFTSSIYQIA